MDESGAGREQDDEALFNRIALRYARKDTVASSMIPRKGLLQEAIGPLSRRLGSLGTVLDVGCGTGAPARYLQYQYTHYIGIDQSKKMIDAARLVNRDIPNARFLAGNLKSVDLSAHSVDLVLSVGALHHMTDLDRVMETVCHLAKKGGHILIIEPQSANPLIQVMRRIRMTLDSSYSKDQLFFSRDELVGLLERNKIEVLSCRYMGFLSTPMAEVIFNPQFLFVPLSRFLTSMDSWLNRRLPGSLKKMAYKLVITGRCDSN